MKVAIYTRVSTTEQGSNYSLGSQLEHCRTYAARQQLEAVAELQDTESGATLERPGLIKLRELIREQVIDAVVVYSQDRLSRNVAHLMLLKDERNRYRVSLHYVTRGESAETPEGNLFDTIEGAFAEYERLKIKERMNRGKRGKAAKGVLIGHGYAPYGYQRVGQGDVIQWVIREEEAMIVRRVFHEYATLRRSPRRIAADLTRDHVPTPGDTRSREKKRGAGEWGDHSIYAMLKTESYAGMFYQYRERVDGNRRVARSRDEWVGVAVPAIIDQQLFDHAQARLAVGRQRAARNAKHFYLLGRSVLKCQCGYVMIGTGHGDRRRLHWKATYYRCSGSKHQGKNARVCDLPQLRGERAENAVWHWLLTSLTPDRVREGIEQEQQRHAGQLTTIDQDIATLSRERASLERQRQKAIAAFQADAISVDELKTQKAIHEQSIQAIDTEIARLDTLRHTLPVYDAEALIAEVNELRRLMPAMSNEERHQLLDTLNLSVTRHMRDDGTQYLTVQCLIGATSLLLDHF
jgi:site-specific DNA recombinase